MAKRILLGADLAGTFLFAIEGATVALAVKLDALGILVLAFATALVGGIVRDLLIGALPPQSLKDWRYPCVAFAGGLTVFFLDASLHPASHAIVLYLDAAALGLFAVAGAQKALAYGLHPFIAVLLGGVTAVGGGVLRDVLTSQIPVVLRTDVYATAALAGAALMVVGRRYGLTQAVASALGVSLCFGLRVAAFTQHWKLPGAVG